METCSAPTALPCYDPDVVEKVGGGVKGSMPVGVAIGVCCDDGCSVGVAVGVVVPVTVAVGVGVLVGVAVISSETCTHMVFVAGGVLVGVVISADNEESEKHSVPADCPLPSPERAATGIQSQRGSLDVCVVVFDGVWKHKSKGDSPAGEGVTEGVGFVAVVALGVTRAVGSVVVVDGVLVVVGVRCPVTN